MKNIDMMIKCRAIFLYDIATIYENAEVIFDDRFKKLLHGFLETYIEEYYTYFDLIYNFCLEDGKLCINEEDYYERELLKYLKYFDNSNYNRIKKLYDEVGNYKVSLLSTLAQLFDMYVREIYDMNVNRKIKS